MRKEGIQTRKRKPKSQSSSFTTKQGTDNVNKGNYNQFTIT